MLPITRVSSNVLADAARTSLRVLAWQVGFVAAVALVAAVLFSGRMAVAIFVGGAIGSVWTVYMALKLFKHSRTHGTRLSAMSFISAWIIKVALTISLLVIAFRSGRFEPLGLLGGLFSSMLAYWGYFTFLVKHAGRADGK